ncbi:MAG: L-histidine N(alpha)-methyltransferase [Thermoanaerobaculia bacterium]|nr:L-histidine N(alpha)-methyltransferase [Thermoanaerobaculia bacterium]
MSFASDVRRGLGRRPRRLPPHWFYDELGSRLFDAICLLPWYRITRAERRLLVRAARAMSKGAAGPALVAELGPGNGEKLALLLAGLGGSRRVLLADISREALSAATARLAKGGFADVAALRGSYEKGLARIARERPRRGAALVLFLGSNLGNFEPARASRFLRDVRSALRPGDGFLLGADLVKPEKDLLLAYDDPLGVTAAFNRNVLARMNRELGADFDLSSFAHRAVWNAREARVEMYLVSRRAQRVRIPGARLHVPFRRGESIFTEASYKYDSAELLARVEAEGFCARHCFEDGPAGYALTFYEAVELRRR